MGVFKRWVKSKDGSKTPYWYIRYGMNGKMKWESVGKVGIVTKTVAQKKLETRKKQVELGQHNIISAKIPTLSEFASEYMKYVTETVKKRSWRRDENSLDHVTTFFGELKLSAITSNDIIDYQNKRRNENAKPATINRELACLKHLFNIARQKNKFFGDNPVSKVKFLEENNQKERILTSEEEERLLSCSAPHLIPIIQTAINTGMRKNEILSLKWPNVDFDNKLLAVEPANSKNKKPRRIPINSILRKILLEQKLKTGFSEFVFLNPDGNPYNRSDSLKKCFQGACRRSNIKGLRFHDLRHTAATRMIETGASIVAVSKILGHSTLSMTMRYAHPENSLIEAVEKLANFNQKCSKNYSNDSTEILPPYVTP